MARNGPKEMENRGQNSFNVGVALRDMSQGERSPKRGSGRMPEKCLAHFTGLLRNCL